MRSIATLDVPSCGSCCQQIDWLDVASVAVAVLVFRGLRRGAIAIPESPALIAAALGVCAMVGAVLGGLLSLKDVVQNRLAERKPVSFVFKLLFGFGMWSLLLVWFPGILVFVLAVMLITL